MVEKFFDDSINGIARAWQQFIDRGELDAAIVRSEIAASWHRCKQAGVDPYVEITNEILDEKHLNERLQRKKALIGIALPFMQKLYEFVAGTGFAVMLSDEKGYILEILGASNAIVKGKEINLVKGSCWMEEIAGTNGIGTALVLRGPVQVSGAEHYCQSIHYWTCSAAPILDNNQQLVGVLQISGPAETSHQHTLGMAVSAVAAIEEQMQVQQQNRELILVNNRLHNIFHTMSEGVVIINQRGVIEQVNPGAERILKRSAEDIEGVHLEDILREVPRVKEMLAAGNPCSDIEINVSWEGRNIHCLASGKAIRDEEGKLNGGVIILSPITKIKNLVNRFSGAQARFTFEDIIGGSPEIAESVRIGRLAALNDNNILLQGESGTGKEVFAQAIHNQSKRCDGPFVALNCAAIPRDLLGSELFGYVEGAFTGAHRGGRPGKFEMASGGTLFLDEIGDMTYGKQGALLRAIQEKAIIRIGDNRIIPVDVRIICASNKNLQEAVEKGGFRRDLFYRLNVLKVNLPPLRQHPEDIPLLFDYFVNQICRRQGVEIDDIQPEIMSVLGNYNWPGNVRELENVVERMVCMAQGNALEIKDIPVEVYRPVISDRAEIQLDNRSNGNSNITGPLNINLERNKKRKIREEQEKQELLELISRFGGNISQVAREMGVSRNTIYRRIKYYNISI